MATHRMGKAASAAVLGALGAVLGLGCSGSDVAGPGSEEPGPVVAMRIVEGDGQSGPVGQELSQPLGVRLIDEAGRGIPGRTVEFEVTEGGGRLHLSSSQTDASGEVRTRWTLGEQAAEPQRAHARTVDPSTGAPFSVEFEATAHPGPPAALTRISGSGQVAAAGEALPDSLVVRVTDSFGNPVSGQAVTWEVTAGGGTISARSADTDGSGLAAAELTLGDVIGFVHRVRAEAGVGLSTTFQAEAATPGEWSHVASLPLAVRASAAAASSRRIFVVGGTSHAGRSARLQIYDLQERSWSFGPDAPVASDWWGAAFLGGRVHVVGGVTDQASASTQHWIYDPEVEAWVVGPPLPVPSAGSAVMAHDSKLYLFGGIDGPASHAAHTMIYDAAAERWSVGPPVPGPRINWSGAPLDSVLLSVGGGTPGLGTSAELVSFDPASGAWSRLAPIPEEREAHATVAARGLLCAMGGRLAASGNLNEAMASTYCYRPESDLWTRSAPLPLARQELAAVAVDDVIYAVGGRTSEGSPVSDVTRMLVR